jgi:hypothetical protein
MSHIGQHRSLERSHTAGDLVQYVSAISGYSGGTTKVGGKFSLSHTAMMSKLRHTITIIRIKYSEIKLNTNDNARVKSALHSLLKE